MKKLLLAILFFTAIANAQIINIPDPNFKAFLTNPQQNIDTNHDGQIQVPEAQGVTVIALSSSNISNVHNVANLEGIQYFTNLRYLECASNLLTGDLDVSMLTNLTTFLCFGNQLTSVNVTGLNQLTFFGCSDNLLTSLDVSTLSSLSSLHCNDNQLTSLNVSNNSNLIGIFCGRNQLTSINLSNLPVFAELLCEDNALTSLDVSGMGNLLHLDCSGNLLTALDVSTRTALLELSCNNNSLASLNIANLPNLERVYASGNVLTEINLSGLGNLQELDLSNNDLNTLNVSNLAAIKELDYSNNHVSEINLSGLSTMESLTCNNNGISNLNVADLVHLFAFVCNNNSISELDMHTLTNLHYVNFSNNLFTSLDFSSFNPENNMSTMTYEIEDNPNLVNLNAKVGDFVSLYLRNCPNLRYICYEDKYTWIPLLLFNLTEYQGITNVEINSYCSFEPSGNYNTISGTAIFDSGNNGCDISDAAWPFMKVKIDDGINTGMAFTDDNGTYAFHTGQGTFTVGPDIENPAYFTATSQSVSFPDNNNHNETLNFCVTANGVHPDLEIVIAPMNGARPGFDSRYLLTYRNKGNQTLSGNVSFNFDDAVLDFVTASPNVDNQSNGNLSFNYNNLMPFESRSIQLTLNLNAPTETPAVNIGDVLHFSVTVNPVNDDETSSDNAAALNQVVTGSYDPNDKTCLDGTQLSPAKIGDYLHYNINFENTGNAAAENIVVKDLIDDTKFDVSSLQLMSASHPLSTKVSGSKVEFIFENINLGAGQHGNVMFKIRTKDTLTEGDAVSNKADIYFDYNFPVTTNVATTTFQALGIGDNEMDNEVRIYPNPARNTINVNSKNPIKSIQLFDANGRVLMTNISNELQSVIPISDYAKGIYFLKVTTEKGTGIEKIIKE